MYTAEIALESFVYTASQILPDAKSDRTEASACLFLLRFLNSVEDICGEDCL